jgi:hypothetical protein
VQAPLSILGALFLLALAPEAVAQKPPKKDPPKKEAPKKEAAKEPVLAPWLGSYEAAKTRAKERNVPLLLHVILEGEQANDDYRTKVLPDKELIAASQDAVVILANNGTHPKKNVEETLPDGTRTQREVCALYGTPNCGAHQQSWDDIYREFHEEDGALRCPQTIVFGPDGTIGLRVNDGNPPPPDTIVAALQELALKFGPGLTETALAEAKKLLDEGQSLTQSGSWPDAQRAWQRLAALAPKSRFAEEAQKALPGVEKALAAEVERRAALLVPGTAAEGYRLLVEYQRAVAGLPIEKDVAARIKKAESDKRIKDEIAAWKLEVEAAAVLSEAQAADDAGDEKKARQVARKLFSKRLKGTQASATARKLWPEVAAEEDAKPPK